jgi:hypothetical protein
MCETVHNRKDSAIFKGRIDDILHECLRLAINTILLLVPAFLTFPPLAVYALPAGSLVKYQYFAASDHGACETQQLFLARGPHACLHLGAQAALLGYGWPEPDAFQRLDDGFVGRLSEWVDVEADCSGQEERILRHYVQVGTDIGAWYGGNVDAVNSDLASAYLDHLK